MTLQFDYTHQAWIRDGRYIRCGHSSPQCGCFGKVHEGEPVRADAETGPEVFVDERQLSLLFEGVML